MQRMTLYIAVFLLISISWSCEEKTDWDLQNSGSIIVADCIITNELKNQELTLYRASGIINDSLTGISGANVEISDGTRHYLFGEVPGKPGHYISGVPFRATLDLTYRLTVTIGNKSDTAFAKMNAITPMEDIDIVSSDSLYRILYHNSPEASMMEIYYDWSGSAGYCSKYGSCQASEVFYTLDGIDAAKEFAPDRLVIRFPGETRIIRRKYSLSYPHQQFIRGLLLETDWRGGLFDAEPGNVPTNFRNGLHGWFGACMVVTDTTDFRL